MEKSELNKIIDQLNEVFGTHGNKLTSSYRKIHEYLVMTIDWPIEEEVEFTMYEYLEDILSEAHADFDGEDTTPSISELFSVNLNHRKLDAATSNFSVLLPVSYT